MTQRTVDPVPDHKVASGIVLPSTSFLMSLRRSGDRPLPRS